MRCANIYSSTKKVSLTDFKANTFRTVVQSTFQGNFKTPQVVYDPSKPGHRAAYGKLPKPIKRKVVPAHYQDKRALQAAERLQPAADLLAYIDFLTLANYIDLKGPFDFVLTEMAKICQQPGFFESKYIQTAMDLHDGHPFRSIVIDFVTDAYMTHMITTASFEFQDELDNHDELTLLVLRNCAKCFASKIPNGTIVAGHLSKCTIASSNGKRNWTLASKEKPADT